MEKELLIWGGWHEKGRVCSRKQTRTVHSSLQTFALLFWKYGVN